MKFKAILDGIEEITTTQINAIEEHTSKHITDLSTKSQKKADSIRNALIDEGRERLKRESALIEQQAEMQYLQNISSAHQKLIQQSLNEVKARLAQIRQSSEIYQTLLHALINESIHDLTSSIGDERKIILSFDPKDREIVKQFRLEKNEDYQIEFTLDCWGGCNAFSIDRKVIVYNTLDDRYKKAIPILQQKLSIFFSEKTVKKT